MEGRDEGEAHTSARTKRELALDVWQSLGRAPVGERELRRIQRAIAKRFGAGAVDSPAAIARLLADEGAELCHPEIIEFDARWRQTQIKKHDADFAIFDRFDAAKPLRLKQAEALIMRLEKLRQKFEYAEDRPSLRRLNDEALVAKQAAQTLARNSHLDQRLRAEQTELTEWLSVWIRTPKLFEEWVGLRKRSAEFRQRFP